MPTSLFTVRESSLSEESDNNRSGGDPGFPNPLVPYLNSFWPSAGPTDPELNFRMWQGTPFSVPNQGASLLIISPSGLHRENVLYPCDNVAQPSQLPASVCAIAHMTIFFALPV